MSFAHQLRGAVVGAGLACVMALAAPAIADDGHGKWGGLYVGANIGWQQTDYSSELRGFPGNIVGGDHSSGIVGIHAGFQHQIGRFVLGLEGSISGTSWFSDFGSTKAGGTADCLGVNPLGSLFSCRAGLHNLLTLGPRLGYALNDQWLIYGTGGWAVGDIRDRVTLNANGNIVGATYGRHDGWFLGAGVEYALTRNWIIGLEYMHVDFDSKFRCEGIAGGGCLAGESRTGSADTDVIRARLSFKLGRDHHEPLK